MEKLIKSAKVAFATEYAFYLKSHFFHWNVEGQNFYEYHKLFELIYSEVYDSLDTFAEKLRALNTFAPGSFSRFSLLTQIEDESQILNSLGMAHELLDDSEKVYRVLQMTYALAEEEHEHGFSNFLAERMDAHKKHSWMLRSSLKGRE